MADLKTLDDYVCAGQHPPRSVDPGCIACGTCIVHDGCADSQHPVDLDAGDCETCGACAACQSTCQIERAEEVAP